MNTPKAIHLPGGNHFTEMRIDIPQSIAAQEPWLKSVAKRPARRGRLRNYFRTGLFLILQRLRLWEPAVNTGLIRAWFDEFAGYWRVSLEGRHLSILDFHQVRFLFRQRFAQLSEFSWETTAKHLANWQTPENIHATLHFLYREALQPVRCGQLFRKLKPGMRVLEYGCSIAPMYRTWRTFLSHIKTDWVLADIPNFPFHYARHVYAKDAEAGFCLITDDLFDDPLKNIEGRFDVIIIHEVFEHLHKPRFMAEYLLSRLNPGGLFFFDYMLSEATGHDTPAGLAERMITLEYLSQNLEMIDGDFAVSARSLGRCIGRLRKPIPS